MTTIFIHVGTHKTGSTTLQTFASRYRAELAEMGLIYPMEPALLAKSTEKSHHGWAASVAVDKALATPTEAVDFIEDNVRSAHASGTNLLLSAESMYRLTKRVDERLDAPKTREGYVQHLRKVFEKHNIQVKPILVFRHPADFIESLYKEWVWVAPRTRFRNFKEFRELMLGREYGHLSYYKNAKILQKYFPDTQCYIFEDLLDSGPLEVSFFKLLGIDVSQLPTVGRLRESTDALTTELKQLANTWHFEASQNWKVFDWLQADETASKVKEAIGYGPFDLWASEEERSAFMADVAEQMKALQTDFFPGREALFRTPKPLTGSPVPAFSEEIKTWLCEDADKKGFLPN